ncbi:MAG: AbrB/MazE/SpoVT family DNA-binding domain-containing protein [Nanoarchaeota archaeon]
METLVDAGTVTITSKNMIVLPKKARQKFDFQEGQKLKVFLQENEVILTPLLDIEQLTGILKGPHSVRELIAESRKNISRFN